MKNWNKTRVAILIIFIAWILLLVTCYVRANADPRKPSADEMIPGHATAYCLHGITASGEETHDRICASCKDRLGCTIVLWQRLPDGSVGEYIGRYECRDTGGSPGIKGGTVIDVWKSDLDECQAFMDRVYEDGCQGKVYIQVIVPRVG